MALQSILVEKTYHFVAYGVDPSTEVIDYNVVRILARKHQPKLIVAEQAPMVGRSILQKFREIADEVGAKLMVDMAHIAGLVAAGGSSKPNPLCRYHNNYYSQNITRTSWWDDLNEQ